MKSPDQPGCCCRRYWRAPACYSQGVLVRAIQRLPNRPAPLAAALLHRAAVHLLHLRPVALRPAAPPAVSPRARQARAALGAPLIPVSQVHRALQAKARATVRARVSSLRENFHQIQAVMRVTRSPVRTAIAAKVVKIPALARAEMLSPALRRRVALPVVNPGLNQQALADSPI